MTSTDTVEDTDNEDDDIEMKRHQVCLLKEQIETNPNDVSITSKIVTTIIVPTMKQYSNDYDSFECIVSSLQCLYYYLTSSSLSSEQQQQEGSNNSNNTTTTNNNKQSIFISSGAFQQTVHILTTYHHQYDTFSSSSSSSSSLNIVVLSMKVLSKLSETATDSIKNDYLLPTINVIHSIMTRNRSNSSSGNNKTSLSFSSKSMKQHSQKNKNDDEFIQQYGCSFICNLSNPLLQELVAAGSWYIILNSMKVYPTNQFIQTTGNIALYNLLTVCSNELLYETTHASSNTASSSSSDSSSSSSNPNMMIIPIILNGMKLHPTILQVQKYGILVLTRLSQKDSENYEIIVSEGGLVILLETLVLVSSSSNNSSSNSLLEKNRKDVELQEDEDDEETDDEERMIVIQLICTYIRNLSRQSLDLQRVIVAKGGITIITYIMKQYISLINIQDPCMAFLRNICVHPDNRSSIVMTEEIKKEIEIEEIEDKEECSSSSTTTTTTTTTSIILSTMNYYPNDAAIQAYGCDALGRLSLEREIRILLIQQPKQKQEQEQGAIATVLHAMETHREHAGVQDRAVFFLLGLLLGGRTSPPSSSSSSSIDPTKDNNNENNDNDKLLTRTALIQLQNQKPALLIFLKETKVPIQKKDAIERLQRLIRTVEQLQLQQNDENNGEGGGGIPTSPQQQLYNNNNKTGVGGGGGMVLDTTTTGKENKNQQRPTTTTTTATTPSNSNNNNNNNSTSFLSKGWSLVGQGRKALLGKSSSS